MRRGAVPLVVAVLVILTNEFKSNAVNCEQLDKYAIVSQMKKDLNSFTNQDRDINNKSLTNKSVYVAEIGTGRGKYSKKKKKKKLEKLAKLAFPLITAVLVAKTIIFPFILKVSTAISASSFVMSKLALLISGLLAMKWITGPGAEKSKVEIVHSHHGGKYGHGHSGHSGHGPTGHGYHGGRWDDPEFGVRKDLKFIPVRNPQPEHKLDPNDRHQRKRNRHKSHI